MRIATGFILAVSIFATGACNTKSNIKVDTLIANINIVDVITGDIITNQNIGLRNDSIIFIVGNSELFNVESESIYDKRGKYAIPGLWDMHVHFRGGAALIEENKNLLPLYTAYGISGVRDAGGDLTSSVLEWRKAIRSGSLIGPDIFTSGPKLDGPNGTWAGSIPVVTDEDVFHALDTLEAIGSDYVKIYDSRISKDSYLSIIKEATKRGTTTSGHMPFTIMLQDAIEAGIGSIEHLYYILKGCSSEEAAVTQAVIDGEMGFWSSFERLMATYDEDIAKTTIQRLKDNGTFVTPTLHIGSILTLMKEQSHDNDEMLNYVGDGIIETYSGRVRGALRASDAITDRNKRMRIMFRELVPKLVDAGVLLLAGSDGGASNSYVYPGISLHKELANMVETGLTPIQALRTATINGAKFMKTDHFTGSIAVGKQANLLILNVNPLSDIRNTQNINMMISNGKTHTENDLEAFKESVRKN
jgi:imidazolonepropionase-like amidohydrolase